MNDSTAQPACYGIIPARFASSRFPGKPLADILGRPMFWHVYQRAKACPILKNVVLATDDQRILAAAQNENIPVLMTRSDHPSGTDRVLEAAEQLGLSEESVVVNIQGDEPALLPELLTLLITPFTNLETQVTTLARCLTQVEAQSPDVVKVVLDTANRALYFSRAPIPHPREGEGLFLGHIGLYAFRLQSLRRFVALGPGRLERIEKLEQLRLLEAGIPVHVLLTKHRTHGVDRPEDIVRVCSILLDHGFGPGMNSPQPATE
jgi:3-deoxy-manno-octulosonate cytidylyltransferase (CMP-KDO synthetase)